MEHSFKRDIKREAVDDDLDLRNDSNGSETKEEEDYVSNQMYTNNNISYKSTSIQNNQIKMKSQKKLLASWLKDPLFKGWLRRHPTNDTLALCRVCTQLELKAKQRCVILKHYLSKKHQNNWMESERNAKRIFARESSEKKSLYQIFIILKF